jgi:phenylacetate-CoA ligase
MSEMSQKLGLNRNRERLEEELLHCYDTVPFYKAMMQGMGLSKAELTNAEILSELPLTTKQDFRRNFPKGVLSSIYSLRDTGLVRSPSAGTTTERSLTFEMGTLLLDRAYNCASVNPGQLEAFSRMPRNHVRYSAPNCSDVECANPNSTTEDRRLPDGTLVLPVAHDLMATDESLLDCAIDEIASSQPDLYYMDPTHFAHLLRHYQLRNRKPPKALVLTTFTYNTRLARKRIEAEFSPKDISQLVSMSELGWLAMECPHQRLHLNTDSFVFELINVDGSSGSTSEQPRELCATSLDCGAMPHIRYRTGDLYTYHRAACECGSDRPCVVVEGRLADSVWLESQQLLTTRMVDEAVGAPEWAENYQLVQVAKKRWRLRALTNSQFRRGYEDEVIARLNESLGHKASVEFESVTYIATERSGKFRTIRVGIH